LQWQNHKLGSVLAVAAWIMLLSMGNRLYAIDLGPDYDQYGGWKAATLPTNGFFSIRQHQGKYWFISPEGHQFLSQEICHTRCRLARFPDEWVDWNSTQQLANMHRGKLPLEAYPSGVQTGDVGSYRHGRQWKAMLVNCRASSG
jgi:hypothetical protein